MSTPHIQPASQSQGQPNAQGYITRGNFWIYPTDEVYAESPEFIIYFRGQELFYSLDPSLKVELGTVNLLLAKINRLLPFLPGVISGPDGRAKKHDAHGALVEVSPSTYKLWKRKRLTLQLAADALSMVLMGQRDAGMAVLSEVVEKLQTSQENSLRLSYQGGGLAAATAIWVLYLSLHTSGTMPPGWEPWMAACALGAAGGAFSVCLTLRSLQVNLSHSNLFLISSGATRALVAVLGGAAALLALRAKMLASISYGMNGAPPGGEAPLLSIEMFFCFLAGFSESFVPNILKQTETEKAVQQQAAHGGAGPNPSPGTPPLSPGGGVVSGGGGGNPPPASKRVSRKTSQKPSKPKVAGKPKRAGR